VGPLHCLYRSSSVPQTLALLACVHSFAASPLALETFDRTGQTASPALSGGQCRALPFALCSCSTVNAPGVGGSAARAHRIPAKPAKVLCRGHVDAAAPFSRSKSMRLGRPRRAASMNDFCAGNELSGCARHSAGMKHNPCLTAHPSALVETVAADKSFLNTSCGFKVRTAPGTKPAPATQSAGQ
jgi:hypothetical protein